jgi:hypothetical protein
MTQAPSTHQPFFTPEQQAEARSAIRMIEDEDFNWWGAATDAVVIEALRLALSHSVPPYWSTADVSKLEIT